MPFWKRKKRTKIWSQMDFGPRAWDILEVVKLNLLKDRSAELIGKTSGNLPDFVAVHLNWEGGNLIKSLQVNNYTGTHIFVDFRHYLKGTEEFVSNIHFHGIRRKIVFEEQWVSTPFTEGWDDLLFTAINDHLDCFS